MSWETGGDRCPPTCVTQVIGDGLRAARGPQLTAPWRREWEGDPITYTHRQATLLSGGS